MKNKEIQPFIKATTKNVIYKMSYITGRSVKQICRDFCLYTLKDKKGLAKDLSPFIKWGIKIEDNVFAPHEQPINEYPLSGELERVNVKIDMYSYEFVRGLAFSLGWSVAKVVAYCIERSMNDFDFVNQYVTDYLDGTMGENQKFIINEIMKDAEKLFNEELSLSALLIDIVDVKPSDQNVNDTLFEMAGKW